MKLEVARQINAPIDKVYDIFTDLPKAPERVSGIESVEVLTDQPFGVGTRWKETRIMMGKSATETMWITKVEPSRSYTAEAESCGTHYTSTFTFEPSGEGTNVTMTFEGQPLTLLSKIISPFGLLMKGAIRKMLVKDLADLAAVCEAGG